MSKVLKAIFMAAICAAALCINAGAVKLSVEYIGIDTTIQTQIDSAKAKQMNAHAMAEAARALGLDENHDAISDAQTIWADSQEQISKLSGMLQSSRDVNVPFGPHQPTGLTATAFNKMLEGTAMAGTGEAFSRMEKETGTNGLFAIGVAGSESGIGAACYGYNPYGMLSRDGLIRYGSWGEATMAFGRLIASNTYSRANTVSGINAIYCPGDGGYWASKVTYFMNNRLARLS